ncbi:hypothetical protein Bp8pS_267 [Bacillus phage vB_BpuM-BpSp]|nr:hypothetical protein Bp8pS_267 [Bacillus phage vB_BpuM-BpSp]
MSDRHLDKVKDFHNNVSDILQEKERENKVLKESEELEKETLLESYFSKMYTSKERDKKLSNNRKNTFYKESFDKLIDGFIKDLVLESLIIDDEEKSLNEKYIHEQTENVVNFIMENDLFNKNHSSTFSSVIDLANLYIEEAFKDNEGLEPEKYYEGFKEDSKKMIFLASGVISDKVLEAFKFEKEFSENINEEVENVKLSNNKTLFRSLHLENIKMAMKEEEVETVNEDVMERSLGETVLDYTILETLNTLRLVEFNNDSIQRGMKRFFNKK